MFNRKQVDAEKSEERRKPKQGKNSPRLPAYNRDSRNEKYFFVKTQDEEILDDDNEFCDF